MDNREFYTFEFTQSLDSTFSPTQSATNFTKRKWIFLLIFNSMPIKAPYSFRSLRIVAVSLFLIAGKCGKTRLVNLEVSSLTALEWQGTDGWRHKIEKEEGIWYYAGMEAVDSSSFKAYLNELVSAEGPSSDDFTPRQGLDLTEQLTLYGAEMAAPTVIRAYAQEGKSQVLIHSSAHADAVFTTDSTGLYKLVFKDLKKFFPDGQ